MKIMKRGVLVIVSGPSGVGKGTILKKVIEENKNMKFAISATTRKPRLGEEEGKNYFFKTKEEFEKMIDRGELLEWVNYCGNFYGKPKKYIEETLKLGYDVIVEVEVEGAKNIKKSYPDSLLIFIVPPSFEDLEQRLRNRGTETDDVIENRIKRAKEEIKKASSYDYQIVNNDVDEAVCELVKKVDAKKMERSGCCE